MPVAIAPFQMSDYPAALALWQRTQGVGLSSADEPAAIAAYLLRNPGFSFVATADGELVGTILCGHDGRRGLIHHLVSAASHRRRGIGASLLRAALQALRQAGIAKCHLFVFRSNRDGMKFWRSVGAEERVSLALFSLATYTAGAEE